MGLGLLRTKSSMTFSTGDHSIIFPFCKGSEKSCSKKVLHVNLRTNLSAYLNTFFFFFCFFFERTILRVQTTEREDHLHSVSCLNFSLPKCWDYATASHATWWFCNHEYTTIFLYGNYSSLVEKAIILFLSSRH